LQCIRTLRGGEKKKEGRGISHRSADFFTVRMYFEEKKKGGERRKGAPACSAISVSVGIGRDRGRFISRL